MREVVICDPVRTPVGVDGGMFSGLTAADLATQALRGLMSRTGLGEGDVDDVVLGYCYPTSEAPAIGRVAALNAGLGTGVAGMQLDRRCGSGLQAVLQSALTVGQGWADVIVAGGVEAMSQAEYYALGLRTGVRGEKLELVNRIARGRTTAGGTHFPVPGGMLETAENLRAEYAVSREEQDEFALASQEKAVAATKTGAFTDEIVPVTVPATRRAPASVISLDEHPRPGLTMADLARLRPVRLAEDPESTVTAGNACGQSDGAALSVVTTAEKAAELGLTPYLRIVSSAVAGVPPRIMGIGPVPAVAKALDRAGLTLADIDLIEVNEAFAVQVIACLREWKCTAADHERLNVNGSGISLGHPAGATGARILATLAHEMRRRGSRYGLETMCMGGGQGLATIFERVA
ncbi:acetyl-CoA C-acetyltransferase [Amycolatopsis acidiphila]|uniref:Probable acetyl-CoA acetyltransferase n=1 Tax=Amycolatopsis acidiphila TaxID=715473 RepID=A0A558AIZ5_9PSEU|nr:acetyl-CoA C-acetyltransferase [Amycolatopsis acidiphila]TVT24233.1 acetyl-CoA C-acyltransferase [Amycolatopsis acidiphila]UIJ62636.1 acetyl-CoA C-acetyltransferase [Amycolatopsis acidiphila]GHG85886.1 acetyl-CoA acetyltransferase [Amycolatopsis acidiphila]